jgi:opacity protein-like surface antigen
MLSMKRSFRLGSWLTLFTAAVMCFTVPAVAADLAKADSDDNSLKLRPTLTIAGGYATNPDEDDEPKPSAFAEYLAKLEVSQKTKTVESELRLEANFTDYFELEDNSRLAYEVAGKTRIKLDWDGELTLKGSRSDDGLSGSRIIEHDASAKWEKTDKKAGVTVTASFESIDNVDEEDNDEDYYKPQLATRLSYNPEGKISPFLEARAGLVRYPRQEDADVNRNGKDYSLIVGSKFKPSDKLELEIGGRYNLRTLDEADISRYDNAFIEASLLWSPTDKLELEAAVVRSMKEPSAGSAVVRDSTEYSVSATWKPTDKLELELSGSHERKKEIGADEVELENSVEAQLSYAVTGRMTVFGEISHDWSRETELSTGEVSKTDNTEFKVGLTTDFEK